MNDLPILRPLILYGYTVNIAVLLFLMAFVSICISIARLVTRKYDTEEDEKLANAMERKPLLGHKVKTFITAVFDAKRLKRVLSDHSETIPIAIGIMTAYSAITWSSLNDDYRKANGIIGCVLFSVFTLCRIIYTFVYWIGIPILRPIVFYLGWIAMVLTGIWTLVILWIDTFEQQK